MVESPEPSGMTRYLQAAAAVCDEMASVVLGVGLPPTADESNMRVPWAVDQVVFDRKLGTKEPMAWIAATVTNYLAEGAHELRALAALLRAEVITGSLGPLVRAIVERVGVICWILELPDPVPDDPEEVAEDRRLESALDRGWRAMLNVLVCYKNTEKPSSNLAVTLRVTKRSRQTIG